MNGRRWSGWALLLAAVCASCSSSDDASPSSSADDAEEAAFECTEQTVGTDVTQRCRPVCESVGDPATARSAVTVELGSADVSVSGVAEAAPVRLDVRNDDERVHDLLVVRGFAEMLPTDGTGAVDLNRLTPLIEAEVAGIVSTATCTVTLDLAGGPYSVIDIPREHAPGDDAAAEPRTATWYLHAADPGP